MTERQIIRRKITLKNQAIKLIRAERDALKWSLFLLSLKAHLEKQMMEPFDPSLSRKLDCIVYLLEN